MVCPGVVRKVVKLVPTLLQALALVAVLHLVGQTVLTKFGSAKYRFSRSYQPSGLGFGSNKVQKVIKYIDKNIPRYSPRPGGGGHGKGRSTASTTSTTPTTPAPPPSLAALQAEQQRRLDTLHSSCVRFGLGNQADDQQQDEEAKEVSAFLLKQSLPNRPMWQNLFCSKEHKLSFCPIFKSASTYILKKLLLVAPSGKYTKETVKQLDAQANIVARKEFGYLSSWDSYPEFTTTGTSIIFVRHPFERLLSAFRDKLEDPAVKGPPATFNEYYYNKYGRRIVMHYRREKITGPTFKYPR